jgi:hypothetical protein
MNLLEIVVLVTIVILVIVGGVGSKIYQDSPWRLAFQGAAFIGLALLGVYLLTLGGFLTVVGYYPLVGAAFVLVALLISIGTELGKRAEREKQAPKVGD